MFGLSAVNAAFLYALAAVSVPIIIHFLFKARKQQIHFSSIEFILTSAVLKSNRIKFRELLLLLLRIAIVALITLAFVRPFLRRNLSAFGLAGQSDIVLLVDDSYSMGYRHERETRFEAAIDRALDTLSKCKGGDRVGIVLLTQTQAPALRLTPNFGVVRNVLKGLKLSARTGVLADGLERSVALLKGSGADHKVVFVLSDFQGSTWGYVGNVLAKLPADVKIKTADLAVRDATNLAVLEFRSTRDAFTPGEKINMLARVANYSDDAEEGVRATLFVEGQPRAEKALRLKPHEVREAAFRFPAPDLPTLACEVRVRPNDGLAIDNSGYCVVAQGRPLRVLCVENKVADVAYFQETFYLRTALDPTAENMKSISTIRTQLIEADQLGKTSAFGYDVLVLADVEGVTQAQADHLAKYVRSGGGLLVFLGPHVEPVIYNKLLYAKGTGVLPARLVDIVATLGKGQEYLHLDDIDMSHPVFELFAKPLSGDLTVPRFTGAFKLDTAECKEAKVLAKFDNGLIAVVEREFGEGKCVLIASTAGTTWTNFPKRMVYLPFVQQLVKYLSARKSTELAQFKVGEPVPVPRDLLSQASALVVKGPDGKEHKIEVARGDVTVIYGVDKPGRHTVDAVMGQGKRRVPVWQFAAVLDTVESDLAYAGERRVAELSRQSATQAVAVEEAADVQAHDGDLPPDLWRYLFLAALFCMALELFIGNRNV